MKNTYTDDEIEFLNSMKALSPETRARIVRLMESWIKENKEKENTNNVIPFIKKKKVAI